MLDAPQVLSVIQRYNQALDLLDAYDHRTLSRPSGHSSIYILTYDECRQLIQSMRFGNESELFGNEKDDSFGEASETYINALAERTYIHH